MRRILLIPFLFLAGCWTGGPHYRDSDARPVIPAGDYRLSGLPAEAGGSGPVRVSIGANGLTSVIPLGEDGELDNGDAITMGIAPLDESGRAFAIWFTRLDNMEFEGADTPYALLLAEAGGAFMLHVPGCAEPMEAIAVAAGAEVTRDDGLLVCRFASRAALEQALRGFAAIAPEREGMRFAPLRRD